MPNPKTVKFPTIPIILHKIISYLKINNLSDSKRQQTFTVDYKRLINGFFLGSVVSLHNEIIKQHHYGNT